MKKLVVAVTDQYISEFLRKTLEDEFKLIFVTSGEGAYKCILHEMPSAVITDVVLPGEIDGFKLFQILKNNEETSSIPVIFVTPYMVKEKVFSMGGKHFISLPNLKSEFQAHIKKMIEKNLEEALNSG